MRKYKKFKIPKTDYISQSRKESRRKLEIDVSLLMLEMYCKAHHNSRLEFSSPEAGRKVYLCKDCIKSANRLVAQSIRCPHMGYKTFCHNCPRPCHKPDDIVRQAMRYSGKRLLIHHPLLGIKHLLFLIYCIIKGKSKHESKIN